jgi:iron(III) transport system permease protein
MPAALGVKSPMRMSPLVWFAVALALAIIAPLLALSGVALQPAPLDSLLHLVSTVLPRYAVTSVVLVVLVGALVLLLGVGAGWLVAAFEFPGRRFLEVGLILPLAMPAFVMAYAYTDFLDTSGSLQTWLRAVMGWQVGDYWFPQVRSLPAAALFLALALYPYVYMLARNAFAERSESLSDAARSLGLSAPEVWWRVSWPVARPAVAAGLALVTMETLADFGTVSFFAVDTFSAGIYRAWQGFGDRTGAARLSLLLVAVVLLLVWAERRQRGRMLFHARSSRPARVRPLSGLAGWSASAACALPCLFGFALPALLLARQWWVSAGQIDSRLVQWAFNSALLSLAAVLIIVPMALAMAYAVRLHPSRWIRLLSGISGAGYALPGVVLGVGLLAVVGAIDQTLSAGTTRFLIGGTAFAVVYAYCVRFFAVAQQGLDASLKRISPAMDASARTLGAGPFEVLRRVHWPLLKPSVASASLLVFVDCLKELPATLVLRPFNFDTLAVVAYQFAADERLVEAALPSLVIVLVGLLPVSILASSLRRR